MGEVEPYQGDLEVRPSGLQGIVVLISALDWDGVQLSNREIEGLIGGFVL